MWFRIQVLHILLQDNVSEMCVYTQKNRRETNFPVDKKGLLCSPSIFLKPEEEINFQFFAIL